MLKSTARARPEEVLVASPKVSVVMPVYNARRFLGEAVQSVLRQTYRDFEFLIFDDGSTDGSCKLLRQCANADPRIRLHFGSHRGHVYWLNVGIEQARGEFYARMDADDVSLPERFRRQVSFLDSHHEVLAVGCQTITISSAGLPIREKQWPTGHEEIEERLLDGYAGLAHPSAMIRLSALRQVDGYREEYKVAQDIDLCLRLAEAGRLANLPDVLLLYRAHPASISHTKSALQRDLLVAAVKDGRHRRGLEVPAEIPGALNKKIRSPAEWHYRYARHAIRAKSRGDAMTHALRAFLLAPRKLHSWRLLVSALLMREI